MLKANLPSVPANLTYAERDGKLFADEYELWGDDTLPRIRATQLRAYSEIKGANGGQNTTAENLPVCRENRDELPTSL